MGMACTTQMGLELRYKIGLRPVVTLKSNINVTESGVLSI